jgi:DnaK suppressor protein
MMRSYGDSMPREGKGSSVRTKATSGSRLKKSDVEEFKERLLHLRRQITASLKGTSEQVKEPEQSRGYSQHQADEGTDDFDRQLSLVVTDAEYDMLRQIDRALEKIDENTYGVCDLSGEPIPIKRLEAIPYATMTVEAQEKFEKGLL